MIIDLVQNSPEWHAWREGRLGGSELPVIMGVSPYKTARRLFLEKTKQIEAEVVSNFATERGQRWEPKVRAIYELHTGKDFPAKCAQHDEHDDLIVSLDGLSDDQEDLEIKVAGAEVFEAAMRGQLPSEYDHLLRSWRIREFCSGGGVVHPKYYPQVQWQLLLSEAKLNHYVVADVKSVKGKEELKGWAVVFVKPDPEFQALLLKSALEFIEMCKTLTPPPASDRDYDVMEDEAILALGKKLEANRAQSSYAEIRDEMVTLLADVKHPRWVIGNFFVVRNKAGIWSFFFDEGLDESSGVAPTTVFPNANVSASNALDDSPKQSEVKHAG